MSRRAPVVLVLAALVGLPLGLPCGAARADSPPGLTATLQQVTPAATDAALVNPGMGLYLFGTRDPADIPPNAWYAPLLNIGYFRDDWSTLEPDAEGTYKFDAYFGPIFDLWVKRWGKRVAFRFMSENMHSRQKYVTPKWVFAKGVPGVTHKGIYVPEQIDPVFWDERYLATQERFIADLGKYLDGRPGLEFIDIGSIGEWGEMHLARWTPQQLRDTGYSEAKYIRAYRRLIDAFARAFPHTRVFLNVGDYATINDYAALRGLHFRQDGLTPSGPSADVGHRFYREYARRGVQCNYELYAGYDEMKQKGWGVRETFAKALEDPISYLHINLMGYPQLRQAPAEVKDAVTDAAQRIGYRFVLTQLRCNRILRIGAGPPGRLLLETTWKNVGVAPCYDSYALQWTLVNARGGDVAVQLVYPKTPTTHWWPGEEVSDATIVPLPPGLAAGDYALKVAMVKPEDPALRIQIGIAGRDGQGRYAVASLPAVVAAGSLPPAPAYAEGFEGGAGGWRAAAGMTVRADTDAHAGHGALLLRGTQPGTAWNFGDVPLPRPVLPASRYRISCWMKVDALAPTTDEPFLKIGLNDATGRWLTNCATSHYDTRKLGTWQHLEGDAETPIDTATGELSVEKGTLESHITATIHVDDVRLELREAP